MERGPRNEKRRRDVKPNVFHTKRPKKVEEELESPKRSNPIEIQKLPQEAEGPLEDICRNALLVVGTYHSVMAGLVLRKGAFYITFSVKHHVGCMNGVAVGYKYVASCGVDERVFLFTNKLHARERPKGVNPHGTSSGNALAVRLAELGSLGPPAEVRCVAFTDNSHHLLCGCADGQLRVFRTRDWGLSLGLPVHGKAIVQLALHPKSNGSLCITIGEDRSVAVLDLAKHRLMTKWKYTSARTRGNPNRETNDKDVDGINQRRRRTAWDGRQQEEPLSVSFSPMGVYWAVQSRFSVVVYRTATMKMAYVLRLVQPQPEEELHNLVFVSDDAFLVGNEAGQLLYATLTPPSSVAETSSQEQSAADVVLRPVELRYRDEQQTSEAAAVTKEENTLQKHPLRHTVRIKALARVRRTLFSIDSAGVVINWTLDVIRNIANESVVALTYITSANCQGRVTTMGVLALG
ncbi:unnamed protein product [Phytomonas sp. Hart1]|nr:unnamed protein product [Phytomonas sp. Hart1]|eukprot:CCW69621.1 unnamed protein product [Phytomonas sp. isolate Hart1]